MPETKKLPAILLAERLVAREVYYSVSTLMWEIKEIEGFESSEHYEDWLNLQQSPPDYEEAATDKGWEQVGDVFAKESVYPRHNAEYEASARLVGWDLSSVDDTDEDAVRFHFIREAGATFERTLEWTATTEYGDEEEAWSQLCAEQGLKVYAEIDEDSTDWEELCDAQGIDADDYRAEVYEHWLVSDWLARRVSVSGEFMGMTIWGRCATGQHMSLDYTMQHIAAETWPDEWNGCWGYGEPEEKKE